jgi:hypothetical protein
MSGKVISSMNKSVLGTIVKKAPIVGYAVDAVETAVNIYNAPAQERIDEGLASAFTVGGKMAATFAGMKLGAIAGVYGGPWAFITVPLFSATGGITAALMYDDDAVKEFSHAKIDQVKNYMGY